MSRLLKKVILVAFGAIVCVVVFIGILFSWEHEPTHNNRSLSQWVVHRNRPMSDSSRYEVEDAIRKIGTNSIPNLVKWISYEEPTAMDDAILCLFRKMPSSTTDPDAFSGRLLMRLTCVRKVYFSRFAVETFQVLGTNASPAIPELASLMKGTNSGEISWRAAQALSYLGKDALHPLLQALANTNPQIRLRAATVLKNMGYLKNEIHPAFPILIGCIQDKDRKVAKAAAKSLCRLRVDPDMAIPAFATVLSWYPGKSEQDFDGEQTCARVISYIGSFGSKASPFLPKLLQFAALSNEKGGFWMSAEAETSIRVIGDLKLQPELCITTLAQCLHCRHPNIQIAAMQALEKFGEAARPAIPDILELIEFKPQKAGHEGPPVDVVRTAFETLGNLAIEPEMVLPAITNWLANEKSPARRNYPRNGRTVPRISYNQAALNSFAQFGNAARPYAIAIKPLLTDQDASIAIAATNALLRIAPEVITNAPSL